MYKSSCAIQHDEKEAQKFGDYIGKLVHEFFENQLPNKKGKPQSGREWTIISAVIMESIIKQQSTAKVLYDLCFYKKGRWTYVFSRVESFHFFDVIGSNVRLQSYCNWNGI